MVLAIGRGTQTVSTHTTTSSDRIGSRCALPLPFLLLALGLFAGSVLGTADTTATATATATGAVAATSALSSSTPPPLIPAHDPSDATARDLATSSTDAASSVAPPASTDDTDEFEGVAALSADLVNDIELPLASEPAPAAAAVLSSPSLVESYVTAALTAVGMTSHAASHTSRTVAATSSTSVSSDSWMSYLCSNWIAVSIGSLALVAGAAVLAFSSWNSRPTKRTKKRELEPHRQHLLVEMPPGKKGRLQGSDWVQKTMQVDEDGDAAHAFLGPF